jgi:hypothetical protein
MMIIYPYVTVTISIDNDETYLKYHDFYITAQNGRVSGFEY